MKSTVAMVLAGGRKPSLDILSRKRAKAAIPFGGAYRIIDFVLTNLSNTSINYVGVLTQHLPASLIDHIALGHTWGFHTLDREIKILPPYLGRGNFGWYKGPADALYQNLDYIEKYNTDLVLVLAGDHIYQMNYASLISHHRNVGAPVTIVVKPQAVIPPRQFGVAQLAMDNRVKHFEEKSATPQGNFISIGVYVFDRSYLVTRLHRVAADSKASNQIAKDLIAPAVKHNDVYGYPFEGPWEYVATVHDYWKASMDLLLAEPEINLQQWRLRTNPDDRDIGDRPPAQFGLHSRVESSIIGDGAVINGTVTRCVIFPGVTIADGAEVVDSVIMHDCIIEERCRIKQVVMDKDVLVQQGATIGYGDPAVANKEQPEYFNTGITVLGKSAVIPRDSQIGCNCLVEPEFRSERQPSVIADGESVTCATRR